MDEEGTKNGGIDSGSDWLSYGQQLLRQARWRLEQRHRREATRAMPLDEALACVSDGDPEMTAIWDDWLRRLGEEERQVLLGMVIHGFAETETARRMGESFPRVHRIKVHALDKLREMIVDGEQDREARHEMRISFR